MANAITGCVTIARNISAPIVSRYGKLNFTASLVSRIGCKITLGSKDTLTLLRLDILRRKYGLRMVIIMMIKQIL